MDISPAAPGDAGAPDTGRLARHAASPWSPGSPPPRCRAAPRCGSTPAARSPRRRRRRAGPPAPGARGGPRAATARRRSARRTRTAASSPRTSPTSGRRPRQHLDALGGVWVPLPEPVADGADALRRAPALDLARPPAPRPTTRPTPRHWSRPDRRSRASALADAETVTDGRLARLFASIGVARRLEAEQLAPCRRARGAAPGRRRADPGDPDRALGRRAGPAIASRGRARAGLGGRRGAIVGRRPRPQPRPAPPPTASARRTWAAVTGVAGTGLDPRARLVRPPDRDPRPDRRPREHATPRWRPWRATSARSGSTWPARAAPARAPR